MRRYTRHLIAFGPPILVVIGLISTGNLAGLSWLHALIVGAFLGGMAALAWKFTARD